MLDKKILKITLENLKVIRYRWRVIKLKDNLQLYHLQINFTAKYFICDENKQYKKKFELILKLG
jgi:hypothetical protein